MAIKKRHVKAVIQIRRANESEWIQYDPVLRLGEPAMSMDVYKLKVGDGTKHWSQIPYLMESEFEYFMENYATKEYVDLYGGNINSISVNGVAQTIDENKNVNLDFSVIDCGTSTEVI